MLVENEGVSVGEGKPVRQLRKLCQPPAEAIATRERFDMAPVSGDRAARP